MDAVELADGVEEEIDSLVLGQSSHVEHERHAVDLQPRRGAAFPARSRSSGGESRCRRTSTRSAGPPLATICRFSSSEVATMTAACCGDVADDRRVEQPLESHLSYTWREHAERLEDVGDAASPRPAGDAGADDVPVAEDVDDVGPLKPAQPEREARRDPHPPVAGGVAR